MSILSKKIKPMDGFLVAAKMLLVFLLLFSTRVSHHYFVLLIAFVIFYGVFHRDFYLKPIFWTVVAVFYALGIYNNFYTTANHTFVSLYIIILLLIASNFKQEANSILYKNARLLLGIIMVFAITQKFLSKVFMSGSSLFFINARGGFFKHFQRFFSENMQIVSSNHEKIEEQISSYEQMIQPIQLESPIGIFGLDAEVFAYVIIAVELLFIVFLFIKNQWIRNGFYIFFMLSLIITREETGFASLLCVLLFLQSLKDSQMIQLAYISIFGLCISLIISKLGAI